MGYLYLTKRNLHLLFDATGENTPVNRKDCSLEHPEPLKEQPWVRGKDPPVIGWWTGQGGDWGKLGAAQSALPNLLTCQTMGLIFRVPGFSREAKKSKCFVS